MQSILYSQFEAVELRVGTVIRAEIFSQERKPAYKLWADSGPGIGVKQTSAQITVHYTPETLVGRQIIGVLNLGTKNIAGFVSEFLCTGFPDEAGNIILIAPDKLAPNGVKLF